MIVEVLRSVNKELRTTCKHYGSYETEDPDAGQLLPRLQRDFEFR